MIPRTLSTKIQQLIKQFPIVGIVGPRQSGKTTLIKNIFANYHYISLEELDIRQHAISDPRDFLTTYSNHTIIDEIQQAPQLFSYLQTLVDQTDKNGQFIITGSQNFLLHEKISQTLAGRVALLTLLPLTIEELKTTKYASHNVEKCIFTGFYPRIYHHNINPSDWYQNYLKTYIERDVRQLKNISDLATFQTFLKMCASRIGQLLNLSSLANDCGINHTTAKAWLSILEASYIVFLLRPHHNNLGKRLVKSPKLYFYDTGLACHLLNIVNPEQITTHYLKGGLFENLIISELLKQRYNAGLESNLYFWRDKAGYEIDCLIETNSGLIPIEIKAGKTIASDYFTNIEYWNSLQKTSSAQSYIIYNGSKQKRNNHTILNWNDLSELN